MDQITIKTSAEIEVLKEGGKKLAQILDYLKKQVRPGINTLALDNMAEKMIRDIGGEPAFKDYHSEYEERPFPSTICASINNQIVHSPASESAILKPGDIISIDIGMRYPAGKGLFTDMSTTVAVGKVDDNLKKLMAVTEKSLYLGIKKVRPGNYISDIGRAIQNYVEKNKFTVIRDLVGHGVGHEVHEEPRIPNYYHAGGPKIKIVEGMVLAIEPMVTNGTHRIKVLGDGWTVVTVDGSFSAHYEHTVAVTKRGCVIVTK